jgi:hypothetical protein
LVLQNLKRGIIGSLLNRNKGEGIGTYSYMSLIYLSPYLEPISCFWMIPYLGSYFFLFGVKGTFSLARFCVVSYSKKHLKSPVETIEGKQYKITLKIPISL